MIESVLQAISIHKRKNSTDTKYAHQMLMHQEILTKLSLLLEVYQKPKIISVREHMFSEQRKKIS